MAACDLSDFHAKRLFGSRAIAYISAINLLEYLCPTHVNMGLEPCSTALTVTLKLWHTSPPELFTARDLR